MEKPKLFIAYYQNDEEYKINFVEKFKEQFTFSFSKLTEDVNDGLYSDQDLTNKIIKEVTKDADVIAVLIGSETWKRKNIDWEIAAMLNQQKPIFGIILSTNNNFGFTKKLTDIKTIPQRLVENFKTGYAEIYNWNVISMKPTAWFEQATKNSKSKKAENTHPLLRKNI